MERRHGGLRFINDLLHSLLRILSESLLKKCDFLDETIYATFDDLGNGAIWLTFLASSLFCNATLVIDIASWNLFAI
jgi:hypothetical protein